MDASPHASLRERREAVVRRHIDAENRGDLDGVIASFQRARYDVVPMGAVSEGEAAVRELVSGLLTAFPDFRFQARTIHHADQAVIVEGGMTGTHRVAWAGLAPKGGKLDLRAACVFDFQDDRLVNETVYFDFAALQAQLG
jgi:steroid delta-isomerase-like uncharacterized protein